MEQKQDKQELKEEELEEVSGGQLASLPGLDDLKRDFPINGAKDST